MAQFSHSVTLEEQLCKGCINCIKRCPTEAIRVRRGRARIIPERCIDCGECIRVCPYKAKKPVYDRLSVLEEYRYTVAIPSPALYGQFNNLDDVNIVLRGLKALGFDDVFEVAAAAELISAKTRSILLENSVPKPVISSSCPAVTRLIRVRFPQLIDHILPINTPFEVAARMARERAVKKTGLSPEDIGVILIAACPAMVTSKRMPIGTEKSEIDAAVPIKDVYPPLVNVMKNVVDGEEELAEAGRIGIGWGIAGGESGGTLCDNYLAADGIENVIRVLEDLEDEKFSQLDFIELNACSGGCVGGVLTVENPYVASAKIKRLRKYLPVAAAVHTEEMPDGMEWDAPVEPIPVLQIADDLSSALTKMNEMDQIARHLPGLDCGSCGAPSCRALAEDIIRGNATKDDCIFRLRAHLNKLVDEMARIEDYIPPPFRK